MAVLLPEWVNAKTWDQNLGFYNVMLLCQSSTEWCKLQLSRKLSIRAFFWAVFIKISCRDGCTASRCGSMKPHHTRLLHPVAILEIEKEWFHSGFWYKYPGRIFQGQNMYVLMCPSLSLQVMLSFCGYYLPEWHAYWQTVSGWDSYVVVKYEAVTFSGQALTHTIWLFKEWIKLCVFQNMWNIGLLCYDFWHCRK